MKKNHYSFLVCLLLVNLTIKTAVAQSFVPVVPDSVSTVVYILRDPAMVGGAVPWPVFCLNRTQYEGIITKRVMKKENDKDIWNSNVYNKPLHFGNVFSTFQNITLGRNGGSL